MSHHADYEERRCKHCDKAYRAREIDDTGYCSEECKLASEYLQSLLSGNGDLHLDFDIGE